MMREFNYNQCATIEISKHAFTKNSEFQALKKEMEEMKEELKTLRRFKEQYEPYLIFLEAQQHWNEMVPQNEALKEIKNK